MVEYSVMEAEAVSRGIESIRTGRTPSLRMMLTDGQVLAGTLSVREVGAQAGDSSRRHDRAIGRIVEIHPGIGTNPYSIHIPFDRITALSGLDVETRTATGPVEVGMYSAASLDDVSRDVLDLARRLKLKIQGPTGAPQTRDPAPSPQYGFYGDTELYWDRDFFTDRKGGWKQPDVGLQAGPVPITLTWTKALWSMFKQAVNKKASPLTEVCGRGEAALQGVTTFLTEEQLDSLPSDFRRPQMDDDEWLPATVSEGPLTPSTVPDAISTGKAVLCYYRKSGFLFPQPWWRRFSQPVSTYGVVTRYALETSWGRVGCFLKARAAAYVHDFNL